MKLVFQKSGDYCFFFLLREYELVSFINVFVVAKLQNNTEHSSDVNM